MTVVIDASLLVSLAANDPRAEAIDGMFAGWLACGEAMHAPSLTPFELANGLTRLVAGGAMPEVYVESAWQAIQELPITYRQLRDAPPVIRLARQLERHSAFIHSPGVAGDSGHGGLCVPRDRGRAGAGADLAAVRVWILSTARSRLLSRARVTRTRRIMGPLHGRVAHWETGSRWLSTTP